MFPELDLSVEEGLKVLASADMRVHKKDGDKYTKAEIYYKDEWRDLYRTDLTDNVGTYRFEDFKDLDETRNYYAAKVKYGIRLRKGGFGIVDSWSDG